MPWPILISANQPGEMEKMFTKNGCDSEMRHNFELLNLNCCKVFSGKFPDEFILKIHSVAGRFVGKAAKKS